MIKKRSIFKRLFLYGIFLLIFIGVAIFAVFVVFIFFVKIPTLTNFSDRKIVQSTKIYDRTGKILLYDIHGQEKRTVVSNDQIPDYVKNATIAVEDDTFYQHYGVRPLSLIRAFVFDLLKRNKEQGGSTITQQLVKQTLLTADKTFIRKIKEIFLAVKVEREYSKDQILNFYLNQIPYGAYAYGIEAASQTFLQKNVWELTPLEAAYMAALPNAPTYYSPCGKHRDALDARARFIVDKMYRLHFLTDDQYNQAKKESVTFSGNCYEGISAPHFVIEVQDQLNQKFGEDAVQEGGYKVTTTLDVDIQKISENSINNFSEGNIKNFNAHNMSAVVIDPKTGDVLALVGSKDYFGKSEPDGCKSGVDCLFDPQVNIATRMRQPGSSFKPIVYATAFKKGYTSNTVLFDVPTEFNPSCSPDGNPPSGASKDKCYFPQNFDNKFRGPVTLRNALAQSLNVPSVKLLYLTGISDSLSTARDFGITSLNDPNRLGLTLVLGGGEVSLLELTSAYGVFANDGVKNPYRYILTIQDENNNTVFEAQKNQTEVIDKNIARTITDILSDDKARGGEFGENLSFSGKQVAAKTGTTNDYRDAWTIGYTPSVVIGLWAGNNNNTSMAKNIAGFIVAPVWHDIMQNVLLRIPDEQFTAPDPFPEPKPVFRGEWRGGKEFVVDKISKKLATDNTPQDLREKLVVPSVHSILFWLDKNNPLGPAPEQPQLDSQFKNWEYSVRAWAASQGLTDQNDSIIPKEYDDIHTSDKMPKFRSVTFSPQKTIYNNNEKVTISPNLESIYEISQVDYFIDDDYIGSVKKQPFGITIDLSAFSLKDNINIKVKAYDVIGNTVENLSTLYIKQ